MNASHSPGARNGFSVTRTSCIAALMTKTEGFHVDVVADVAVALSNQNLCSPGTSQGSPRRSPPKQAVLERTDLSPGLRSLHERGVRCGSAPPRTGAAQAGGSGGLRPLDQETDGAALGRPPRGTGFVARPRRSGCGRPAQRLGLRLACTLPTLLDEVCRSSLGYRTRSIRLPRVGRAAT